MAVDNAHSPWPCGWPGCEERRHRKPATGRPAKCLGANIRVEGDHWIWIGHYRSDRNGRRYPAAARQNPTSPVQSVRHLMAGVGAEVELVPNCDNTRCVRPEHMGWFTPGSAATLSNRGSGHPNARLTEDDVRSIRRERSDGATVAELATKWGMSKVSIHEICARRKWRHVP